MEFKQVILMRSDLGMGKGKMCAQAGHAAIIGCDIGNSNTVHSWKNEGMRKVVLKVNLPELTNIATALRENYIQCEEIIDFGLTQIEPKSITCLAIEPLCEDSPQGKYVNDLTKDLKLL